jgi:hypothetical protein
MHLEKKNLKEELNAHLSSFKKVEHRNLLGGIVNY